MANRIVVDPVTRIEGHLRIEVEVKDGKVVDAYSSGTMVRGFELILKGRDPRDAWAFTERACGVCTTVHALASVRAVEDAIGITVPPNAELIRNLMFCAQYLQDHAVHFYHLHALDWVDVVSALKADPKNSGVLNNLAWANILGGNLDDALEQLTAAEATAICPVTILLNQAHVLWRKQQFARVAELRRRLFALAPVDRRVFASIALEM